MSDPLDRIQPKRPNPTVPSEGLPMWMCVVLVIATCIGAAAYFMLVTGLRP